MKQKGLSTRAERLASPRSCATKRKPKRSAKAAISGTGTISRAGAAQHHHMGVVDHDALLEHR